MRPDAVGLSGLQETARVEQRGGKQGKMMGKTFPVPATPPQQQQPQPQPQPKSSSAQQRSKERQKPTPRRSIVLVEPRVAAAESEVGRPGSVVSGTSEEDEEEEEIVRVVELDSWSEGLGRRRRMGLRQEGMARARRTRSRHWLHSRHEM